MASSQSSPKTLTTLAALEEAVDVSEYPIQPAAVKPRRSALPPTSQARIIRASPSAPDTATAEPARTVLYLASGSNMCAKTFEGKRGIRPLSAVNVVVPELHMTFDLPGLPYTEPCFATTAYRSASPPLRNIMPVDEKTGLLDLDTLDGEGEEAYKSPSWPYGLVGVVYEVTLTDYAKIIATEGGGASYQDIVVTCHELPSGTTHVPETPTTIPFEAHTLYTPATAEKGDGWMQNRRPGYAQPSPRYLNLITDGGEEHALPADYMSYLMSLVPYRITNRRQRLGQFIFLMMWGPWIAFIFGLVRKITYKGGRSPKWVVWLLTSVFGAVWTSYDGFFRGVFGDGERTMKKERKHVRSSSGEGEAEWGE